MKNYKNIILFFCLILSTYLLVDKLIHKPIKIGVVQMDKLVYEFKGMKEATMKYSNKMKQWGSQSDSLERKLEELLNQIKLDSINKDKNKLKQDIQRFVLYKRTFSDYVQNSEIKAQEEDKEMTLGVVNQLNEYIKSYASEKGYDIILTNSQQQSIGYTIEKVDITVLMLDYANKKYEGLK